LGNAADYRDEMGMLTMMSEVERSYHIPNSMIEPESVECQETLFISL